jgi:hypothetical protein
MPFTEDQFPVLLVSSRACLSSFFCFSFVLQFRFSVTEYETELRSADTNRKVEIRNSRNSVLAVATTDVFQRRTYHSL